MRSRRCREPFGREQVEEKGGLRSRGRQAVLCIKAGDKNKKHETKNKTLASLLAEEEAWSCTWKSLEALAHKRRHSTTTHRRPVQEAHETDSRALRQSHINTMTSEPTQASSVLHYVIMLATYYCGTNISLLIHKP